MFDKIEDLRKKLNDMIESDNAMLHSGKILSLSQELDKHIAKAQVTKIKKI